MQFYLYIYQHFHISTTLHNTYTGYKHASLIQESQSATHQTPRGFAGFHQSVSVWVVACFLCLGFHQPGDWVATLATACSNHTQQPGSLEWLLLHFVFIQVFWVTQSPHGWWRLGPNPGALPWWHSPPALGGTYPGCTEGPRLLVKGHGTAAWRFVTPRRSQLLSRNHNATSAATVQYGYGAKLKLIGMWIAPKNVDFPMCLGVFDARIFCC